MAPPRKGISESRELVWKEILATTNRPRFCYMGYAPPLCIGDEYVKPRQKTPQDGAPFKPLLVSAPSCLFSTPQPLCVGDLYVDGWRRGGRKMGKDVEGRPSFKPAGFVRSPPGIVMSSVVELPPPSSSTPLKKPCEPIRGFLVPISCGLFHPLAQHMPDPPRERLRSKNDAPPFRVSYGSSKLFGDGQGSVTTQAVPNVPVLKEESAPTPDGRPPFKPAGRSPLPIPAFEHVSDLQPAVAEKGDPTR